MVPGVIQAEDFDPGAYQDTTEANEGGEYRPDEAVDIKAVPGGHAVGWMIADEWLEYTLYVSEEGDYPVTIRSGSADSAGKTLSISQCGSTLVDRFAVPQVGNWGDFKTWSAGSIRLLPGYQIIRIHVGDADYVDLDWIHIGPYGGTLDPVGGEGDTLKVEFDQPFKPVTHVASGALYGVVEHIPQNIEDLVAPLSPSTYVQPALAGNGAQQPYGAAIAVAGRLAGVTNAKVAIRLADVHPGWPYRWSGWSNWETKIRQVVTAKRNSGRSNYYGYEIWNEPDVTWQSTNGDFLTVLWKPTYDLLRSLDPQAKIIGPANAYYSESRMLQFLNFCKTNNCLPDIICWHQLQGSQSIVGNIANYRAMERQLGISPRLISINEYSHDTHEYEGAPGVSVPFIAKFERHGVDSANISWWFPALPGRLGSLITAQNQRNGGWWLYKWYGDMRGNMVKTTPPNDRSDGLDGFANIDLDNEWASVVVGGNHQGSAYVSITGLPAEFGYSVEVTVERVTWSGKESPVSSTVMESTKIYGITSGALTVSINITNPLWGYRIYLTPQ